MPSSSPALFAVAFFTMALITFLFGGRCGFLFVAMAIVSAMLGSTGGLLSGTVVPGKAAKSELPQRLPRGDLAFCYPLLLLLIVGTGFVSRHCAEENVWPVQRVPAVEPTSP